MPLAATDCPDGLGRCEGATVLASRLGTVPSPCRGPASQCTCPWDPVGDCPAGCAAEGTEVVVDRRLALAQLCAPARDAPVFAVPLLAPVPPVAGSGGTADAGAAVCDEGDRYECTGGEVVDCASGQTMARCVRGCFFEGTSIDDDGVSREAAFAILCSR
jgi:hypothetical protein